MMLKNGRLAGWISLWSFRRRYSKPHQKFWMNFAIGSAIVSLFCIALSLLAAYLESDALKAFGGYLGVVGAINSVFGLSKDFWSFVRAFRQEDAELCRYKNLRPEEKRKLDENMKNILPSSFEMMMENIAEENGYTRDAGYTREEYTDLGDFVYYYPMITQLLLKGWRFVGVQVPGDNLFARINNQLDSSAVNALSLRLKAADYRKFYNEDKINLVANPDFVFQGKYIALQYSMSCYYASYLTTEFYRDQVRDRFRGAKILSGDWNAFDVDEVKGETHLNAFDGYMSLHLGVNTLAVTNDGWILIWEQAKGARSKGLAAPSGSGSMDFDDIADACKASKVCGGDDFNSVISYAAERELGEEMFGRREHSGLAEHILDLLKRLPIVSCLVQREIPSMDTRVIGMFRWGSLGGLPGFVCVTRINCWHNDILHGKIDARLSEGHNCAVLHLHLEGRSANMIEGIDRYKQKFQDRLSLPLRVSLDVLKDAVRDDAFCSWVAK